MRKNSSQWEVDAIEVGEHRPRQFEFHPTVRDRLLCGTIRGDLLILSTEHGVVKHFRGGYAKRNGDAILGLCWFNTKPNLFVSGSASGVVKCGNWQAESDPSDAAHTHVSSSIVKTFEPSSQLTSVSLNCLDEKLLTSGYSRDIRIDDVETGTTVHKLADVHTNHINISRFAHHSPTIFATSSFDRTAKVRFEIAKTQHSTAERFLFSNILLLQIVRLCLCCSSSVVVVVFFAAVGHAHANDPAHLLCGV